ncbi:MAG: hypothetical protein IT168_30530 [Bryobacterales bacterium]|nr:hypothetical protein [Bryobacterales bacterium]
MSRKQTILFAMLVLVLFTGTVLANNVVVLPAFTGGATASALVLNASNLSQTASFNASTDAFAVLTRARVDANDTKYYVIARSGSSSLLILNNTFQPIGNAKNLGQNVNGAAISPDGNRLLLVWGDRLHQYRTDTDDEVLATRDLDIGAVPVDVVVSQDSQRAFVLGWQSLTAIDLTTNQNLGRIQLPGLNQGEGAIAMGPNGMLYVSAGANVLEVDPRAATFETATRRRFQLPAQSKPGRLQFTPDGSRAFALNTDTRNNYLLFMIQIDYLVSGVQSLTANDFGATGVVFEKLFIAGNNLGYLITSQQSTNPRSLYQLSIPAAGSTAAQITAPTITPPPLQFRSLGSIPIVDQLVFSPEYPNALRGFISAPLNTLAPAARNTVYGILYGGSQPDNVASAELNFLPGNVFYAGPANTRDTASGTVAIAARYGASQPTLAVKARTLPFGIRVTNGAGAPLFGVPVTFAPAAGSPTLVGQATVLTNDQGIALVTGIAPETPGEFTFNVSVQGSGATTSFTFTVPSAGGNPGENPGDPGTPGANQLLVIEGNGQVMREGEGWLEGQSRPKRTVVRLLDSQGKPVANANVTWSIASGGGRWRAGTIDSDGKSVTVTDQNGESYNVYVAPENLGLGNSYLQSSATIQAGSSTQTVFFTTIARSDFFGQQVPWPSAMQLAPTLDPPSIVAKAGQTVQGAIRYRFQISGATQQGANLQYIGLSASTGNTPATGPVVQCAPTPIVLSDETGVANCDLKISGKAGEALIRLDIGGGYTQGASPFILLRVDPGDPQRLTIANGNNQAGNPNATLPAQLAVVLDDGGGNTLSARTVRWEVISGQATLANPDSITDTNGRAVNTVRLGTQPGTVLVRATALGGTQPTVTFELRVNVTVAGLSKVSGEPQQTFTGSAFAQPLVVQVSDSQGRGIAGQTVNFGVTSGSATVSAASAATDTNGRAQVTVRAGATPGPIQVTANLPGAPTVEPVRFTLTSILPGPVVNPLDFYNAASGERGAVVPGGLFTVVGAGIAQDLRGCVTGNTSLVGPYPTRVANVEVQFGTVSAPILSVCNDSGRETVTVQVPFELAANSQTAVTIRVGGGSTVINGVQVRDLQPGTFETVDSQNRRYAVAVRPNGSYVTPDNPARWGELIKFYVTGLGQVSPQAFTGVLGTPSQAVNAPIVVGLNDAGVRLDKAVYSVGQIGVYEITFEVPEGTETGSARPLGILVARPSGEFVFPANSPTIAIDRP